MGKVIFYKKTDDPNKARITLIHGRPEMLSKERKSQGVEVDIDKMPPKDQAKLDDGYKAVSYINPTTKEITYEYEKSQEKKDLESLQDRVSQLEGKVNKLRGNK